MAFSGAKSLTVLNTYNKFLLDDDGNIVSWERFKSRVADIDPILNVHHLQTERKDAIATVQMADKWETLKNFDLLEYSTVGDNRVRESHRALDRLVFKSNDPLLDKIYPPKDHGCRCIMIPAAESAMPTDRSELKALVDSVEVKPYFKHHPGKAKVVYDENEHPYYKNVKGKVSELQAERNYGMKNVKQIYANTLPPLNELHSKEAALDWWTKMAGDVRGNFEIKAQNGISILFDNNLRNHVFEDNKDNRWSYFHNAVEVLNTPDEIWAYRTKKGLEHRYIKYYEDCPVIVGTNDARAFTVFKTKTGKAINVEGLRKSRQGVLIYKNENR